MIRLSDTEAVPAFISSERASGYGSSQHFAAMARDCASLAARYEEDVRIFSPGSQLHRTGADKSKALRASEALFSAAAREVEAEEVAHSAELAEAEEIRRRAYDAQTTPAGAQLPLGWVR